ncbi:PREDICTED: protein MRG1-like isoform X2 [Ipomoea nil]|uniref:protein MRG1-like isoform X2 n=1 Tax=Ipomoea nil TaxID=35883 RepID=UPI0009013528|nr:PREDICTED: protein MRG1-like isoform X2 [Ipomoea nil]
MVSSKDESATDSDKSSGEVPDSNSSLYSEGEKVLAYHGPRIYEAKGWNKNWDEWVGTQRLMKLTDDNIIKQQALDKKLGVEKNTKLGRSSQTKPKASVDPKIEKDDTKNSDLNGDKEEMKTNVPKGKKRKGDSTTEKDNASAEKLIKIQIPLTLKKQLVDDWEFITQQNMLVKLPRSPSVDDILTNYLEHCSKKDGMMAESVGEILNGIRSYFDKSLPVILLYKKERQQYHDTVSDNVSPSSVYGAEHLLRLFVKLPELLACVKIEEETLTSLQQKLLDFLKFLQKNQGTYFLSSYEASKASDGSSKAKDS